MAEKAENPKDADVRSSNKLALFLLIFGKALGVAGLVMAFWSRPIGGVLLLLDGAFIVAAIVISVRNGARQIDEANADKAVVARLVREGALKQYLREIEDEKRDADKPADEAVKPAK